MLGRRRMSLQPSRKSHAELLLALQKSRCKTNEDQQKPSSSSSDSDGTIQSAPATSAASDFNFRVPCDWPYSVSQSRKRLPSNWTTTSSKKLNRQVTPPAKIRYGVSVADTPLTNHRPANSVPANQHQTQTPSSAARFSASFSANLLRTARLGKRKAPILMSSSSSSCSSSEENVYENLEPPRRKLPAVPPVPRKTVARNAGSYLNHTHKSEVKLISLKRAESFDCASTSRTLVVVSTILFYVCFRCTMWCGCGFSEFRQNAKMSFTTRRMTLFNGLFTNCAVDCGMNETLVIWVFMLSDWLCLSIGLLEHISSFITTVLLVSLIVIMMSIWPHCVHTPYPYYLYWLYHRHH